MEDNKYFKQAWHLRLKSIEQRLRALERKNIKNEDLNHTPLKMSHKFQIDLLNKFLKLTYPVILTLREHNSSLWYNIQDKLDKIIGNGDVFMEFDDNNFRVYCHCSSCNKRFVSEELVYEHNKSEHTVMSATDSGKGMNSDKPTIIINDDPVGITLDRVGNKVISIEFSDLNCGICENEVVSPDNFCIVDNQLFHFDCVIEARNVAGGKIDMQNTERRKQNDN